MVGYLSSLTARGSLLWLHKLRSKRFESITESDLIRKAIMWKFIISVSRHKNQWNSTQLFQTGENIEICVCQNSEQIFPLHRSNTVENGEPFIAMMQFDFRYTYIFRYFF